MSWYKRAQNYDLDMSYTSIGHTYPYENEDYHLDKKEFSGCNQIWAMSIDGKFKCCPEVKGKDTHDLNNLDGDNAVYKGRVDTCKNIASLICIGSCNPILRSYNPLFQRKCEKLKMQVIDEIQKRFGTNTKIQEFK